MTYENKMKTTNRHVIRSFLMLSWRVSQVLMSIDKLKYANPYKLLGLRNNLDCVFFVLCVVVIQNDDVWELLAAEAGNQQYWSSKACYGKWRVFG